MSNFNDTPPYYISKNVSNAMMSQSFRLDNRGLQGQEQLDFSVTLDLVSWYPGEDQYSTNDSSCARFLQSYTALNGSTACHNTAIFTCHRLWINPGL
jgi:hypothetical protein